MYNVEVPTYPDISIDEYFKYTSRIIDGVSGLQVRNGPYGAVSSSAKSDGLIHFCGDKDLQTELFLEITDWIDINAGEILDGCLKSFVEQYWEMRDLVIDTLIDEDPDVVVPRITSHHDLRNLCGIVAVHVKGSGTKDAPRFGIEFGCNWEEEHGAGVSFNGLNVIESGEASDAFEFE